MYHVIDIQARALIPAEASAYLKALISRYGPPWLGINK